MLANLVNSANERDDTSSILFVLVLIRAVGYHVMLTNLVNMDNHFFLVHYKH